MALTLFSLRVRLIKKFAPILNGIDLTGRGVGEIFDCNEPDARMLVLEGWAELVVMPGSSQDLVLQNEMPSADFRHLIELVRDARKDKIRT